MKVFRIALLAIPIMLAVSVTPVAAAGSASSAASAGPDATNPSQYCANNGNSVLVQFGPGPEGTFPLEIPSHGGCASTVATRGAVVAPGDYSQAAFVAQCKLLKGLLPPDLWNAPVTIVPTDEGPMNVGGFGGKIETCTWLLQAYHSGTLSHPE